MNGVLCKKRYTGGRMSQASAWSLPAAVTRRTVETRDIRHLGHRSGPAATTYMLHVCLSSVTPYQLPYCHFPLQQLVARRRVNVQFVSRASYLPLLPPPHPPVPRRAPPLSPACPSYQPCSLASLLIIRYLQQLVVEFAVSFFIHPTEGRRVCHHHVVDHV